MKLWIGLACGVVLSGCGTIETVSDESKAVDNLARWDRTVIQFLEPTAASLISSAT